uniref:Uncharacterized protein n=1 Tax=Heterorhabditis bacteriophora TaxID=37862 RepID=A0A1I7WU11_HETBA
MNLLKGEKHSLKSGMARKHQTFSSDEGSESDNESEDEGERYAWVEGVLVI